MPGGVREGGGDGDEGGEVGKPGVESSVQQNPRLTSATNKVQNSSGEESLDFRELRVTAGRMPSVVCESNSCEIIF